MVIASMTWRIGGQDISGSRDKRFRRLIKIGFKRSIASTKAKPYKPGKLGVCRSLAGLVDRKLAVLGRDAPPERRLNTVWEALSKALQTCRLQGLSLLFMRCPF